MARKSLLLVGCLQGFSIFVVLLLVAGCAGRPKNVLLPVADTAPSSSRVEMLVTTTRSRSTNRGEMFTGERGPDAGICRHHRVDPAKKCSQRR